MVNKNGVTYSLSCYMSPPGELAVLAPRHDQSIALWRHTGRRIELARLWEIERISGQKHHAWPLYTPERAETFLSHLLAQENLTLTDITHTWGTPGLPHSRPLTLPAGAEKFPIHSVAHLFSGLLMDTELFKNETIIAMAMDSAPDAVLDTQSPEYWYAGCVSVRGKIHFAPVESPAPLYNAASTLFCLEPGTLMALATACPTTIDFDIDTATEQLQLHGGRTTPWAATSALVEELTETAAKQLAATPPHPGFSTEETLRNVRLLADLAGIRTQDAYLSTSGGFALNCPTNTLLLDTYGFRGLLTPPCANDSDQALGLGLLGLYNSGALDTADLRIGTAYHGSDIHDLD